jgi:hypothetical protein
MLLCYDGIYRKVLHFATSQEGGEGLMSEQHANTNTTFDWRQVGQHLQEYLRVSTSACTDDLWNLYLQVPRAQQDLLKSGLQVIDHQIDALQNVQIEKHAPGAPLMESARLLQLYSMRAQAEILRGYLALVEGTLHVLENLGPAGAASTPQDTQTPP